MDAWSGKSIAGGRYLLGDKLGEGAMGSVYIATQHPVGRDVVVKFIRREFANDPEALARFKREIQTSAQIEHPNTVRVYDCGDEEGQPFLVTEYLRGRDLQMILANGKLRDVGQLVAISKQIALGLHAAHSKGIIHRDMKPSNVMVLDSSGGELHVKVMDFGVAKSLHQIDQHKTQQGMILGTPAYMSPEQCSGHPIDTRSDLYSLGVVMFQMATGQLPFNSDSVTGFLLAHVSEQPPHVEALSPELPLSVSKLIAALLDKDPNARPASAAHVASRLEEVTGQVSSSISTPSTTAATQALPSLPAPQPTQSTPSEFSSTPRSAVPHKVGNAPPKVGCVLAVVGMAIATLVLLAWGVWGAYKEADDPDAGRAGDRTGLDDDSSGASSATEAVRLMLSEPDEPEFPAACLSLSDKNAQVLLSVLRRDEVLLEDVMSLSDSIERSMVIARLSPEPAVAEQAASSVAKQCPTSAVAHNLVGNALAKQGQTTQAIVSYTQALERKPDYLAPRFNAALVYLSTSRPDKAVPELTRVIDRRPAYPQAKLMRGRALLEIGENDKALADIADHLQLDEEDADAWVLAAMLLEETEASEDKIIEAWCAADALGAEIAEGRCPDL